MSIYATLWRLQFPRHGEAHVGCEWEEVVAQGVPAHVGTPTPGYGYEGGAYDTTRRALAKGAGSFAPNSYVVGVDAERELLLVHQLDPSGGASELDPLELG